MHQRIPELLQLLKSEWRFLSCKLGSGHSSEFRLKCSNITPFSGHSQKAAGFCLLEYMQSGTQRTSAHGSSVQPTAMHRGAFTLNKSFLAKYFANVSIARIFELCDTSSKRKVVVGVMHRGGRDQTSSLSPKRTFRLSTKRVYKKKKLSSLL